MHEITICESLLREVAKVAAANRAGRVDAIWICVGPLSGVEHGLLARAFEVARTGTLADRATLEIEVAPVTVWCSACGTETAVAPNALLCGACGTWKVQIRSGDELLLKRVELGEVAEAAALS